MDLCNDNIWLIKKLSHVYKITPIIIINNLFRVFGHGRSDHTVYGYTNDDYLMVCYNTDYIRFVKVRIEEV